MGASEGTDPWVALRKESVDRNREQFKYVVQCRVALRKESVDRNSVAFVFGFGAKVALRKESVDRNQGPRLIRHGVRMSLSARRAWIEIEIGVPMPALPHGRSPQGERG